MVKNASKMKISYPYFQVSTFMILKYFHRNERWTPRATFDVVKKSITTQMGRERNNMQDEPP